MRYLETIKIQDGILCNLEYHHERVCHTIGVSLDLTTVVPEEFRFGVVKYRIVYDKNGIVDRTFSRYTQPTIKTLKIVECQSIDYGFKYENRSVIAQLMSRHDDCDDILIIRDGKVTDSSFCNIVFECKGRLYTPKYPLLNGTKRQQLIDNAVVEEREISFREVRNFDRIFLINAMIDIYELEIVEIK